MPCTKCENGKYKWGKTGECKYATKEACEKANSKKYNKMRPTPLGKKSYEDYEKELSEYNKANELKLSLTERIELGLFDDTEKLSKEAKGLTNDLMALNKKQIEMSDTMKKKIRPKSKELADDELELRREVETREERLTNFKKSYKAARDREKDFIKTFKDQIAKNRKGLQVINKLLTKVDTLGNKLENKIVVLKKAGDELGVKVSTKTFESALKELLNAFKKVNSNIGGFKQQANQ